MYDRSEAHLLVAHPFKQSFALAADFSSGVTVICVERNAVQGHVHPYHYIVMEDKGN
jgi:hypothetical protein